MISVASQKRRLINVDFIRVNRYKSAAARSGENGGCSSVVTLSFGKISLTETDRCAGALSSRRNQLCFLHFSGRFLLTASLRQRRMSMYSSLLIVLRFLSIIITNSGNVWKLLRIKVGLYILVRT
jgi:hypothetical protein